MQSSTSNKQSQAGPKRRQKHYSYNESVNEAPHLLDDEPVDMEQAIPAEENEPVEEIEDKDESASPIFEEGPPSRDEPHE